MIPHNPASTPLTFGEDLAFDVWSNLTARTGKHWSLSLQAFGGTYDNNRMNGWQYDADGRNTVSNSVTSTFDAAGRLVQTSGPQRRNNPPLVLTQGFDGDGQQIQKTEYGQDSYLLRSTALSGAVVTEIYGSGTVVGQFFGQKQKGHVYLNGDELAVQAPILGEAIYIPVDPSGVEDMSVPGAQLDPLGNDVGDEDPYLPESDPGFSYPHMGDISDPGGGCTVDGTPWACTIKARLSWLPSWPSNRFRRLIDLRRTPSTFPNSQITLGTIFREAIVGTPLGGLLYPRPEDTWRFINPTFPGQVFPPIDVDKLKGLIQDRLNYGDCANYVASLINKAAELSGGKNPAASTNIMELFERIRNQPNGGIVFAPPDPRVAGGGGTTEGYYRNGSVKIRITPLGYFADNPRGAYFIPAHYGLNGLHEVIHAAGQNATYREPDLLRAVRALEPNGGYSDWNAALIKHCLPSELSGYK